MPATATAPTPCRTADATCAVARVFGPTSNATVETNMVRGPLSWSSTLDTTLNGSAGSIMRCQRNAAAT